MNNWLGSYRRKHGTAKIAKTAKTDDPARNIGRSACALSLDMPAGAGICPGCAKVRWLAAGSASICKDCEIDRLNAAARATVLLDSCESAGPNSTSWTDDAIPLPSVGAT